MAKPLNHAEIVLVQIPFADLTGAEGFVQPVIV
jgi:hypothetical protein